MWSNAWIWPRSAFFGRLEQGKKPGFPRFKARFRDHSLTGPAIWEQFSDARHGEEEPGPAGTGKTGAGEDGDASPDHRHSPSQPWSNALPAAHGS